MTNKLDFSYCSICGIGKYMAQSLVVTDLGGTNIVFVNDAFTRMYGYTDDEIIGQDPAILNAEDNVDEIQANILSAVESGKNYHRILKNRRKDNTTFLVDVRISPLEREGKVVGYIGVQTDVTDREAERLKFLRMVELLDMASNKSRQPLIITDEGFRVLYCNKAAKRLLRTEDYDKLNAYKLFGLSTTDIGDSSVDTYEGVVEFNEKKLYIKVDALHNTIVHGYALYPSDYDLSNSLKRLQELDYLHTKS